MKDRHSSIISSSTDLSLYILDQTGVVTVAGDSFGAPNYIRFSYATSENTIETAMHLLKEALKNMN